MRFNIKVFNSTEAIFIEEFLIKKGCVWSSERKGYAWYKENFLNKHNPFIISAWDIINVEYFEGEWSLSRIANNVSETYSISDLSKIEQFLMEKPIRIGEYDVTDFSKKGFKVGCTQVSWDDVVNIIKKGNELGIGATLGIRVF